MRKDGTVEGRNEKDEGRRKTGDKRPPLNNRGMIAESNQGCTTCVGMKRWNKAQTERRKRAALAIDRALRG